MPKRNRSSSSLSPLPNPLRPSVPRRRRTRTRSMISIMKDDMSLVRVNDMSLIVMPRYNGVVLGKPNPVTGRSDLSWTLLKSGMKSHRAKLTKALHVMHECFQPSTDPVTHKDVAEDVILNPARDFYTVVLEKDGKVATVATVRVHGDEVAEAPLVGTAFEFQRQGMCTVMMSEIEKWLRESCGVRRLVLPSAKSALMMWTSSKMGFETVTEDERTDLIVEYDCLDFQDTVMCQKILKKCDDDSESEESTISHEDHEYILGEED